MEVSCPQFVVGAADTANKSPCLGRELGLTGHGCGGGEVMGVTS